MPYTPTSREKSIIDLLALGLANKEIGARLGIREGSVKTYIYKIRQKCPKLGNRYSAVKLAVRDHERVVAIRLNRWIQIYGETLDATALAEIREIMAGCVADVLK